MIVTCDHCQRRYTVPDEKLVPGKPLRLRCKNCQQLISVAAPEPAASPWEDEPTRAAPALDLTARWHAVIGEAQAGPFDVLGLEKAIRKGQISLRTMVWREGMDDWARAQDLPELVPLFAGVRASAPPPPPEPPAPPPEPEPAPLAQPVLTAAPQTKGANLDALFGDLDLEATKVKPGVLKPAAGGKRPGGATGPTIFVEGEADAPPRRKRWPLWVALVALLLLGAGGYLLFGMKVQPVGAGAPTPEAASDPVGGPADPALRRAILGKAKPAHRGAATPRRPAQTMSGQPLEGAAPGASIRRTGAGENEGGGPSEAELRQAMAQLEPAFASCVDAELKRNPSFRAVQLELTATVAASGKVSSSGVVPKDAVGEALSGCLKEKVGAVVFAPFSGAPVDLEIPVNLTAAM